MLTGARIAAFFGALVLLVAPLRAGALEGTPEQAEQRFVALANQEREGTHAAYVVAPDLVEVARRHAARMASENRLYHNPRLQSDVQNWDAIGENVGRGTDADQVHTAFMNSPTHRDNILSPTFTEVGMGVAAASDGGLWVAQVFRKPGAEPAPPPPPPSTTTSTAPPPPPPPPPPAATEPSAAPAPAPPSDVRAASAARASRSAQEPVASPTADVAPATTPATEPAPAPEPVPVDAGDAPSAPATQAEPASAPNPGTVQLASARTVAFTAPPEVSLAVVAAAALLLAVVAGQAATFRRLRLI